MNRTSPYSNHSKNNEKQFKMWIALWISASILLFLMNTMTTPGFWWSGPFILLWSVLMGAQALKIDKDRNKDAKSLLSGAEEESFDPLEQEKKKVLRQWDESDFV